MRFTECTFQEIITYAKAGWLAIVPTGCTEQQGPHLPVDLDTWLVEKLCLAATEAAVQKYGVHALVLPALPFGPTPEHKGFGAGYIDLPQETHEAVVSAILNSLAEQGFRRIVVLIGCGQHVLQDVIAKFNSSYSGKARAFLPSMPGGKICKQLANPSSSGHAGMFGTSLALYLKPQNVRANQIFDPKSKPVDWSNNPNLDFTEYSSTGVIGNPTLASAELGEKLWHALVEDVSTTLKEISETTLS